MVSANVSQRQRVVIAGGGLSGLSTAIWLSAVGYQVTLVEARGRLGGRTIKIDVPAAGAVVDNGQHALLRCYTRLCEYLETIGTQDQVHWTTTWVQREPGRGPVKMTPVGMLKSGAVPLRDLPAITRTMLHLARALIRPSHRLDELSVDEWLRAIRAPQSLRTLFFDPFVIALNDTPDRFSAYGFIKTLRLFIGRSLRQPRNLGLGYATTDLHSLFVAPAEKLLDQRGGTILRSSPIQTVLVDGGRATGLRLKDGTVIDADAIVLATPAWDTAKIIEHSDLGHDQFFSAPAGIESAPIVSVYVWLDGPLRMTQSFEGLLGTTSEWIFDRTALYGERDGVGYGYSLVTSAAWQLQKQTNDVIVEEALASIRTHFPDFAEREVVHTHVVRQPKATFTPTPRSHRRRLPTKTPINGLVLAGDWTDTGMSSLMEGAAESGHRAAQEVMRQRPAHRVAAVAPVGSSAKSSRG